MHLFCAKTKVALPICRMISSFMFRWKWFQLFHLKMYHALQHLLVQKMSMQVGWNHENENRNLMQIGWNHENKKRWKKTQEAKMENQISSPRDNKNWKEHRTKATRWITPSGESGQGHSPALLSSPRLMTLPTAWWPLPTSIARPRRKHRRSPSPPWLGKDMCLSAASDVFLNIYYWFLRGHFIYIGIGQYYDKNLFTSFGSHGAGQQRPAEASLLWALHTMMQPLFCHRLIGACISCLAIKIFVQIQRATELLY